MQKHAARLRESPFDGTVFHLNYPTPDGKPGSFSWEGWGRKRFRQADLEPLVAPLRDADLGEFRHNFPRFNTTPADLDWFDDYSAVLENARLVAWYARETKCPGILFDVEQYQGKLFHYALQRDARTRSFEQYSAQARRRGREVMQAFQQAYPGLTVFLTAGYSYPWQQMRKGKALREVSYGLVPAFLDGMLEVAEGDTKIVDGHESAYGYTEPKKFAEGYREMAREVLPIVSDSARYGRQFRFSFGIWMDRDSNTRGWSTTDFARNGHSPEALERLIASAMQVSDEYVWLYSERLKWWTAPDGAPENLPDAYREAVRRGRAAGSAPAGSVQAINEVEMWQQVGQQPYEFTWVQRQEDPRVLENFENLKGWTLELHNGASGELRRSREQQLWGQHVAKFLYSGTGEESLVIARPPAPIPIPGAFDSVDLWGYGNRWNFFEDKTTPPGVVAVWVQDARGREFRIELTNIRWKQWWLIHRRVPAELLRQIALPAAFTGIEISKAANRDPRYFFCDSLAFYAEELKPLALRRQPKRNLKPWRGQNQGLNTGEGTLPFPTREETILPSNLERQYQINVRETAAGRFELRYQGRDATVVYEYLPRAGVLGEITASVNGGPAFHPLDGGGLRFAGMPEDRVAQGELVSARLAGDAVQARFRYGARVVDFELRLMQKSLVLDAWCEGGDAVELRFGQVSGVSNPRLITVPYLTYAKTNPRVLVSGAAGKPVFTSVWFDWYRTNASEAYAPVEPKRTASSAEINGGMRYLPKTDGRRNGLYERIFVTSSPVYEEVLPTIANPPAPRGKEASEVVWTYVGPEDFRAEQRRSRSIRAYGLEKIMEHTHEVTWRDEGDSNTLKLQAAPQKGGDPMLQWFVREQQAMGWRQGVYTNYTDFCTVNSNWNPDHVIRLSDGEWRRSWPRNYKLKPSKAVEFDEYYAQRIRDKFGVNMAYTDVHTAQAPWDHCDYDARVPGAGTLAATFYAYGQLLLNDQRVYGPTQSEGTYQWLYAGLTTGNPGFAYTPDLNLLTDPLDVSFMLTKIHPLECDFGMGPAFFYFGRGFDSNWQTSPKRRDYLDLFLATTIAYGNMGWLVTEFDINTPFGVEAMVRSYYTMQQLQQQYALQKPVKIEYAAAGDRMVPAGEVNESRLHVVYENGTEVYVNRAAAGLWTVKDHQGRAVELPPSGWLVFRPANGFYEISANVAGRRIEYVNARDYEYLDGRGQWTEHGKLGARGGVVVRRQEGGRLELIDLFGNDRIGFASPSGGTLTAYDADGKSLGAVPSASPRDGWVEFKPAAGARSYRWTW